MRPRKMPVVYSSILLLAVWPCRAENIDPYNDGSQYGYGENVGWVNFEPSVPGAGAHVTSEKLTGFIWAENIGWIKLDPTYGGVVNDGTGRLSGYAWGENVGWINFNPIVPGAPLSYGVTINQEGRFSGWAYGENIGWINFNPEQLYGYGVRACVVDFHDLAAFADLWLAGDIPAGGPAPPGIGGVDFGDYAAFAQYWREFCPDGWQWKPAAPPPGICALQTP